MTDQARRRTVIIGAVGTGALAACSSPPVPDAQAPSSTSPSTSSSSSSTAPPAPSETSTTEPPAGGTPTSDVPVGGGTIYADKQVVVTQPEAGTFKAFDTTCTHQGCAVTSVSDGLIHCPCHGSSFDIASGGPTEGSQATSPLAAKSVTVSGDTFTVA